MRSKVFERWPVRFRAAAAAGLATGLAYSAGWIWVTTQTSMWANYHGYIAAGLVICLVLVALVAWRAVAVALQPVETMRLRLTAVHGSQTVSLPTSVVRVRAAVSAGVTAAVTLGTASVLLRSAVVTDLGTAPTIAVAAASLFVAAAAWIVTGYTLRSVEAVRAELATISASSLTRRVPVPRYRDEITKLAITINDTLDRLERAAETQRRFTADAAHELRSPLASLLSNLEVAAAHPDQADWQVVAQRSLTAARRLHNLTDDLLLLARLDRETAASVPVDLASLVQEQVAERAYLNPGGPQLEATIDVHQTVAGTENDLSRILRNLLDNASRYARTSVGVSVTEGPPGYLVMTVADDGPGIPWGERHRVFQRFTRVDEDRNRDSGGTGLGLAIARDLAARHGATIHIAESASGARLEVKLRAID